VRAVLELEPSEIIIDPDRFRPAEPDEVKARAASINTHGQLQPILVVIDENGKYRLVAGLHRTKACELLKRKVDAVTREMADEITLKTMELEENISRLDMHWTEREKALAYLHKLKTAADPTWTQAKTAVVAKVRGQADVSESLKLVEMLAVFPELAEAKNKNQALSWAKAKAAQVMRVHDVAGNHVDYSDIESKIVLGDSVDVIKTIPDGTFHAIITDPPFGIDYDSRKAGTEGSLTAYKDDEDNYRRLLSMAPDLYRVLKPNGWLIWFFGISWYEECKRTFRDAGFTVDELPIVWNRSSGRCITRRPDRYFARAYDVALHCIKGDPQMIIRNKPNVLNIDPVPSEDMDLIVERPVELYEELLLRLTVPGERVADFFVGSGSCPAACAKTRRDYFGVELSAERRAVALQKIKAYTPDSTNAQG
jgi:ParB/RepB/Spo0J family partition protein